MSAQAVCELCSHCSLPVGRRATERTVDGERRAFCCYGCCIAFQVKSGRGEEWDAAWLLIQLGVGAFLSMNVMMLSLLLYADDFAGADASVLPWIHILLWVFATPAVVILGGPYLRDMWRSGLEGRMTSSTLIVLGVAAAYLYSAVAVIEGSRYVYFDTATMVLMLFTTGRYLEAVGRARAARDLEPLLAAERESATVVEGGAEFRRPVRDVGPGALVRVRPGERIPIDGTVVEGESNTDEALITGESRHVVKQAGSAVIAGSINVDGPLLIRSSGAGTATRWAQICRSVREALATRSPTQRIADLVVGVSVPAVLALGGFTVAYWAQTLPFDRAMLIGLSVLVVACPCAVGLAAPMATSLGIGRLAKHGCLVREPGALEALARARLLAFDKTGTLTSGRARVVGIDCDGAGIEDVLAQAAGLGRYSEHSVARAVVTAAEARGVAPVQANNVRTIPGRGIRGNVDATPAAIGSGTLMSSLGWPVPPALVERARMQEAAGRSVVYVGWGGQARALLSLDDSPLPEARATISHLRARGLDVALLTGDLAPAAKRIADIVGIGDVQAGLSPEGKREALERLRQNYGVVAMVGDGLNDGPVLAHADIGIAVGSATDLARETASLVLPQGGLWMLPWVVDVSRAVRRTTLSNLMWAFGYNAVALTFAALGLLQPILAAAVMAGSSILVVLNSLRLERLPDPVPPTEGKSQDTAMENDRAGQPELDLEDRRLSLTRRGVLAGYAGLAFAAGGLIWPPRARADDEIDEVVKKHYGRAAVESDRLHLRMPADFPTGYIVPLSLDVDCPMTEADHVRQIRVFAPRNPLIEVAAFQFVPQRSAARVSTRIRLAKPQSVVAVAEMNDGSLLMAKAWVAVATNGCE